MNHKTLGFLCSAGVLSLMSGTAQAQVTAGALQLGLGTDVVTYTDASATVRYPAPLGDIAGESKTTRWGFASRNGVNLEGGYGLGDSIVLGGLLGIGSWSEELSTKRGAVTAQGNTNTNFDLFIAPKFDYMFLPGTSIRPFVGGAIGVQYFSQKVENPQNNGAVEVTKSSATGLALMPRVGVRFFLTPGFSIDPAFVFLWVPTASGSQEQAGLSYDLRDVHSYTLGLTVAASGWVGL